MAGEEARKERRRNKTEQQAVLVTCRNMNVRTTLPVSRPLQPREEERQRRQEVLNVLFSLEIRHNNINTPTKTDREPHYILLNMRQPKTR